MQRSLRLRAKEAERCRNAMNLRRARYGFGFAHHKYRAPTRTANGRSLGSSPQGLARDADPDRIVSCQKAVRSRPARAGDISSPFTGWQTARCASTGRSFSRGTDGWNLYFWEFETHLHGQIKQNRARVKGCCDSALPREFMNRREGSAYFMAWVPWVMAPPARRAAATMTVSLISASVAPASRARPEWISMQ